MPDIFSPSVEPTVNVPLLRKTLEHITAHPDEWNQTVWARETSCGTAYCLAGTAVTLQGHELEFFNDPGCGLVDCCGPLDESVTARYLKGGEKSIERQAREDLGLSPDQADILFAADNSLAALWTLAERYTDGEIETPESLPDV